MTNKLLKIKLKYDFLRDYLLFKKKSKKHNRFKLNFIDRLPQLFDKTRDTAFDPHYTYHPAWAARVLKKINPKTHVDISSILSFSIMVSAFIPVKFYDYRPANLKLEGLTSDQADLLALPFPDNSITSLSCMHTIEHVGLGRYGDPIDPEGDLKAIDELKRVIAPNGNLLFVVPIGKPILRYNAHRVYSYDQIKEYFSDFVLNEFSLIPDDALRRGLIINSTKEDADMQIYGCGCFWFIKK